MIGKINLETIISQNGEIDASELNGEKVMINIVKGKYFIMNKMGTEIWDLIEKPKTVNQIVDNLLKKYEVKEELCITEVKKYLEKLKNADVIKVS